VTAGRSPLHDEHERLGARFVDFAGWSMPVQYAGTLAEHRAVRRGVGVFDVSHLGRFRASGSGTTELLSRLFCNDISRVEPGRAQYTMMLTPEGGIVDDLIIWRIGEDDHWVLPNGVNHDRVLGAVAAAAPEGTSLSPARDHTALVAVQGPEAPDLLEDLLGWKPGRFRVGETTWDGRSLTAAGTGYTGERGGEIILAAEDAPALFRACIDAGAKPCGLGARDTLRLEMGYPLWGRDLDTSTSPLEADLGWVVSWDHDFIGREALDRQRTAGIDKRLVGFAFGGRTIPRHGYRIRCGESSGRVTSGNFSPTLEVGIGMGYLAPDPGDQPTVDVEIRGRWVTARRTDPPFIGR